MRESDDLPLGIGGIRIPRREIRIRFVRSGGPGGQNVNKVATKAVLEFHVADSSALNAVQKARIGKRLAKRIDGEGILRLRSERTRSRVRNEADVLARLADLLRGALVVPKRRIATRPTRASKERRLETKRRRGAIKVGRRPPEE